MDPCFIEGWTLTISLTHTLTLSLLLHLRMDTYSNTFLRFQLRMDLFGDDEAVGKYMLDAINEDTRANTTQPIAEEDARTVDSFLNMSGDSSYKTHRKSKAEQEEKLHAMQEEMTRKVASLESQMDARVNNAVQLALSQRGTARRTRML